MEAREIKIRELDLDLIQPNASNMNNPSQGGSKIVVIGKPGAGKSTLIKWLCYMKRHIYPVGLAMSGTERENHFYKEFMPPAFIFNELNDEKLKMFIKRQRLAKNHLKYPWSILVVDDCTDDPKILNRPLYQGFFKNGRHWKMLFILALQYCMDVKPVIRTTVDGVFILKEINLKNRKALYENYCGIIPDFSLFCELMDQITEDNTALYIHNTGKSNNWQDCVFWCKAKVVPDFKLGCQDYWDFNDDRYDPNYVEPVV